MATITHKGTKLVYEEHGEGKPALIFLHGWTCNRSFFAPQAEHFARRHRVVSVDLRGHGESDKPQGKYPIATYADDVAYLIEELDLGKVVAVGHSLGAYAVLQLAAAYPDHVAAIVMIEPGPLIDPPEMRAVFEATIEAIEAGNQEPRREVAKSLFLPTSDPELVNNVLSVMMAAPSHVAASAFRGMLDFDGPTAATQCKVPALHLAATYPAEIMSQWLPTVVNGQMVGAGHVSQLEVPDQVNAMIEGFMRHYV
jgi:pimeloyl-ACP methyl ester carboxylesterase